MELKNESFKIKEMKTRIKFLTIAVLLVGSILYSCSSAKISETDNKKPLLIYAKGEVYKTEWTIVDSLEQNGLTKSALTEVETIYKKARVEKNHEQIIKALMIIFKS